MFSSNPLQRYPSISIRDDMKNWNDVKLDTSLAFGSVRGITTTMINEIQQELEKLVTTGKRCRFVGESGNC